MLVSASRLVFVPEDEDPGQLDCHSRRAAVSCLLMAKWEVLSLNR